MGIEYYIIDEERDECFELGKGYWGDMPLDDAPIMLEYMLTVVKPGFEPDTPDEYFETLSDKISEFTQGRSVRIITDNELLESYHLEDDYEYVDEYSTKYCKLVGDRYEE